MAANDAWVELSAPGTDVLGDRAWACPVNCFIPRCFACHWEGTVPMMLDEATAVVDAHNAKHHPETTDG